MENSLTLVATESFSYSWSTTDRKLYSCDANSIEKQQSFHFDVPLTASSLAISHADEIFADGHIMPVYVDRENAGALQASTFVHPSPILSRSLGTQFVTNKNEPILLGKWGKSFKKMLNRCLGLGLAKPLRCSRKNIRVDDIERRVCEFQSWQATSSPRTSSVCSVADWCNVKKTSLFHGLKRVKSWSSSRQQAAPPLSRSHSINVCCDVESSIHEAILYCKRSIEK